MSVGLGIPATFVLAAAVYVLAAIVGEPTVLLTLRRPVEVRGVLGRRRTATAIALTIDAPDAFIAALAPDAADRA